MIGTYMGLFNFPSLFFHDLLEAKQNYKKPHEQTKSKFPSCRYTFNSVNCTRSGNVQQSASESSGNFFMFWAWKAETATHVFPNVNIAISYTSVFSFFFFKIKDNNRLVMSAMLKRCFSFATGNMMKSILSERLLVSKMYQCQLSEQ